MLRNTDFNRAAIKKIATALGPMNQQMVYVGGATVCLYINDPAADDVRPTKDVDITLDIASLNELEAIRMALNQRGFYQTAEDTVICRFHFEDIKVDLMNTRAIGWAPANPWFQPGFKLKETMAIGNQTIQILPLAYFLASKFSAFNGRGAQEARTSHDFEDITYILDNRTDIHKQIAEAPDDVRPFLSSQLRKILEDRDMQEAVFSNLPYQTRQERYERIISFIKRLINK